MLLYSVTSTVVYFQQAEIVSRAVVERAARTAVFARIDMAVNVLTVMTQLFLTGRIVRLLGVGMTLAILPLLTALGFAGLGILPALATLVVFQVLRRGTNYAVARPARETLYTVVSREDRYKAKSFIDTVVYRTGDQVGAWAYSLLGWLGLGLATISFLAAPIAGLWMLLAIALGRGQARRAAASAEPVAGTAAAG
jgi:AAA family ATP:ADP antiporter